MEEVTEEQVVIVEGHVVDVVLEQVVDVIRVTNTKIAVVQSENEICVRVGRLCCEMILEDGRSWSNGCDLDEPFSSGPEYDVGEHRDHLVDIRFRSLLLAQVEGSHVLGNLLHLGSWGLRVKDVKRSINVPEKVDFRKQKWILNVPCN